MPCFNVPGDLGLKPDGTDLSLISGPERFRQRARVGFLQPQGTWKFDLRKGFPWREVLGERPDPNLIRTLFWEYLAGLPDVRRVVRVEVNFTRRSRVLAISWEIVTRYGEAISDVQIFGRD